MGHHDGSRASFPYPNMPNSDAKSPKSPKRRVWEQAARRRIESMDSGTPTPGRERHPWDCGKPMTPKYVGKVWTTGRYHRLPRKLEDDYVMQDTVLGSGFSGEVLLAIGPNGEPVAVKTLCLKDISREMREQLEQECEIFLDMDHPHIARLLDVYQSRDQLSLVMECCNGGELFERIAERGRFSESEAADAAWQMLLAIKYIHSHHVVHRDVKLENFLFEARDVNRIKLIDFGFAKVAGSLNTKMHVKCGTLAYCAPEVLAAVYDAKCDLWSLGVSVFITLFGYMPFRGTEEQQKADIMAGKVAVRPKDWKETSTNAQSFVARLLIVDPAKRMSAKEALRHPWIAERDMLEKRRRPSLNEDTLEAFLAFGESPPFRRASSMMMAMTLSKEQRTPLDQIFMDLDPNRTGTISLMDFKEALKDHDVSEEVIEDVFAHLDITDAGKISYTAFLAAMVSAQELVDDDLVRAVFRRFDRADKGFISATDLTELFGPSHDVQEVTDMMEETNGAHRGMLTLEEFRRYLQNSNPNFTVAAAGICDEDDWEYADARKQGNGLNRGLEEEGGNVLEPILEEDPCWRHMQAKGTERATVQMALEVESEAQKRRTVQVELELEYRSGCSVNLELAPAIWLSPGGPVYGHVAGTFHF